MMTTIPPIFTTTTMPLPTRLAALLLLAMVAGAFAATVCLEGTIDMTHLSAAPETPFCNATQCTLQFSLSFDTAAADSQSWPLSVALQDGTTLAERWPDLDTVTLQCNSAGDIIASTRLAGAGEHLRLIWTYEGSSSLVCNYALSTVDLAADFASAQALFFYRGNDSVTADALWATADGDLYSLAAETVDCPVEPETTGTTGTTGTSGTTATTGYEAPPVEGDCRYPRVAWQTSRSEGAEWLTIADATICTIPVADIVLGTGDSDTLPPSFAALAAEIGVEMLNDAMYELAIGDINVTAVQHAYEIVTQSLNCASSQDYSGLIAALAARSNSTATCGSSCSVETLKAIKHSVMKAAISKTQSYLAGLIACAIVAAIFLAIIVLMVIYIFWDQIRNHQIFRSAFGAVRNQPPLTGYMAPSAAYAQVGQPGASPMSPMQA